MSASKESTGTLGNLANIPKLESTAGWINWSREMKDHLTMSGYGDCRDGMIILSRLGTRVFQTWVRARAKSRRRRRRGSIRPYILGAKRHLINRPGREVQAVPLEIRPRNEVAFKFGF
ncbi:hypothetical protein BGZ61DRAFT_190698 [Ilyonectria robusta]|uniref:uncharacterized protein n=1 Tax=Ilyonectria robusta TaxID=1079257 RepID=UPI001E8E1872|nr:uncharacterized protein BGZ61DRAFT_190698 [Ilyonectria robusta]KAH8656322.1 hypothetical protein BGZ61DRAFT_190698 [Ilyonectria robusta]